MNQTPDRDEDGGRATPTSGTLGANVESSTKDTALQGGTFADGTNSRLRTHEPVNGLDQQLAKVQFAPANNYFKHVSENKDVSKLVALLATCINATKKVRSLRLFSMHMERCCPAGYQLGDGHLHSLPCSLAGRS